MIEGFLAPTRQEHTATALEGLPPEHPELIPVRAPAPAPRPARDRFLDLVRTIAVLRVILWHALGAPVLTYLVAAVPAMVFVSGSLLETSLAKGPARAVLTDRFRRLLVPYWAAVGIILAGLAALALTGHHGAWPGWRALSWLVPVLNPLASRYEDGWLSAPWWYIRLMVWMLLLAVPLRAVLRRHGARTLVGLAALTVLTTMLGGVVPGGLGGALAWYVGDLSMFGGFLALGMLSGAGRLDSVTPQRWAEIAMGATLTVAVQLVWLPAPGGNANHSHLMLGAVGVAWLAAALALRAPLTRVAEPGGRLAGLVTVCTRRSLTIYLWHPLAIIVAYAAAAGLGLSGGARIMVVLTVTVAVTAVACLSFGWIEDRAAHRPGRLWPAGLPRLHPERLGMVVGASVALALALIGTAVLQPLASSHDALANLDAPSRQPFSATFAPRSQTATLPGLLAEGSGRAGATGIITAGITPGPVTLGPDVSPATRQRMTAAVQSFLAETKLTGLRATVTIPGGPTARLAVGRTETGAPLTHEAPLQAMSVSKTYLAAIVMALAREGRIDLDAPIPPLRALPRPDALAHVTPFQLLAHRSTLVDYHTVVRPGEVLTPVEIATRVINAGPVEPRHQAQYSSSNAFMLALLVEQVAGRPYDEVLRDRITAPYGLSATRLGSPGETASTWASGGVFTTLDDLARWGTALLAQHRVVTDAQLARMATVDGYGLGAGLWGFCPCDKRDGHPHWAGIGHPGAKGRLTYFPAQHAVVALEFSRSQFSDRSLTEAMDGLSARLAELVAAAPRPRP